MTAGRKLTRRPASARGTAAAIAIAGAVLCSCTTPSNAPASDSAVTVPAAQACIGDTDRPTDQPLSNAATEARTSALSPTAVTGAGYSWSGGDTVYSLQAITEFPVPAGVVATTDDVVLASYSVTTTYPGGWNPSQSLQATAFSAEHGTRRLTRSCPSQSAPILDAMRAAGHVPLPDHIAAGQTVTGWAAFVVPRTVTDLTMRVQHVSPGGGGAASYPLLHIPHP
jgi:hypothetical protein